MSLNLIEATKKDEQKGHETTEIKSDVSIKGFHTVTLTLNNINATAAILTEVFGYKQAKQEDNIYRYQTDTVENAALIDMLEERGLNTSGTNHHIAFLVKDELDLMELREKIVARGLQITGKINRDYFYSLYFREPGGLLFEIANDSQGLQRMKR